MLTNVPLMIVPFITYNIVALGFIGDTSSDPWQVIVLSVPMLSGATWSMQLGDLMVTLGLLLLFFEIMKATRIGADSIIDHLLSTFVLIAFIVEFLLVESAAHAVFFILMVITFVDVIAGFSVSIRSATRDVTLGGRL
ncbi:MAG: hypothetical protein JKY83_13400 [Rhizobiaceae bacterium]|nr:hypothetical protein [Rhizobiaceae bacterium]